ncbi:hypothetical protein GQ43DRAFT_187205 [Delitschia confertaspora ATCC 74209]|uniref:Uncharacterized protein n=1 Tax=Delitschia confertaspora ATCC 74209 TaxID=1513339 RepID=A0A9P4MVM1_9PLEO|nr:hypothetical protein GQ43DRAFT_187205 [Delitschia confertaspora ATCC 74209]
MSANPTDSQGRALAIALPTLTFLTHTLVALLALNFSLSPTTTSAYASWFSLYNTFAAGASIAGLNGAVRWHAPSLHFFTTTHTFTLLFLTLTFFNFMLPVTVPVIPNLKFNTEATCREMGEFGWDAKWAEQCRFSFEVVQIVVGLTGLVLLGAHWWALDQVRGFAMGMKKVRNNMEVRRRDMEKGGVEKTEEEEKGGCL